MRYIEAIINMAFPLEKENLRTLFLSNSEIHPCVGEPVIHVTELDKNRIGADSKQIIRGNIKIDRGGDAKYKNSVTLQFVKA